jgi:hypothetical protein
MVQASVPLLPEGRSWDDTASILPASKKIDYFKLFNMSTVGNGTTGASGTGPASGYNLVLSHLFIVFFLLLYRLSANTSNPYTAIMLLIFTHSMICFMIFGIKICRKMPKNLTSSTTTYLLASFKNDKTFFQDRKVRTKLDQLHPHKLIKH